VIPPPGNPAAAEGALIEQMRAMLEGSRFT
jgi:hypothetical protein